MYLPVGEGKTEGSSSRVVGWNGGNVSCIEGSPGR